MATPSEHRLLSSQNNLVLARWLLGPGGADVNKADSDGDTALHCACYEGLTEIVQLFLQHNANVSIRNDSDYTALEVVIVSELQDIVKLLLALMLEPKKST